MNKVLYFPYINVPADTWFTQVLLYWDEVGTIVPRSYINKPETLDSYMRSLVSNGLVKQIIPDNYIYKIPMFNDMFLKIIDDNPVINNRRKENQQFTDSIKMDIHLDKIGIMLASELNQRNLCRGIKGSPWYEFEKDIGELFMAYLAAVLGNHEDICMSPISDNVNSLAVYGIGINPGEQQVREIILEHILPVPTHVIDVDDLASFKNKYHSQLVSLREKIERYVIILAKIPDDVTRVAQSELEAMKFNEEIEEIQARMRDRHWGINFTTITGVAAAAAGTFTLNNALSGGDPKCTVVSTGLSLVSAISSLYKSPDKLDSPLAYAVLARNRFSKSEIREDHEIKARIVQSPILTS